MKKTNCFFLTVILLIACVSSAVSQDGMSIRCSVGYLWGDFRVFNIADLINEEMMEAGVTIDAIENFFYMEITADERDYDVPIYIEVIEELGNQEVIRYVTSSDTSLHPQFTVNQWREMSPGGDGRYENQDFAMLEGEGAEWFRTDMAEYADYDLLAEMIADGNLVQTTFTIRFTVYRSSDSFSLHSYSRTMTVYNPCNPELADPMNGDRVDSPPVLRWTWTGHQFQTSPMNDWVLYVVEGPEGEGDFSVIGDPPNPIPSDIRYEGPPNDVSYHTYTNFYPHEELTPGHWYHWAVQVTIPTASGGEMTYNSEVFSFQYGETEGGEEDYGQGPGRGPGEEGEWDPGEDEEGEPGEEDLGDVGLGEREPGLGDEEEEEFDPGLDMGKAEIEDREVEMLYEVLSQLLTDDDIEYLREQFKEYRLQEIVIDGERDRTITQLSAFLNIPGFMIDNIEVPEE